MHAWLAVCLSALCVFSTAATDTLLTINDDWHPRTLRPRGIVISVYLLVLWWTCFYHIPKDADNVDLRVEFIEWSHSFGLVLYPALLGAHSSLMVVADKREQAGIALTAFFGLPATIHLLWAVLHLKYAAHKGCDLNTGDDNGWKLGQLLAMIMLAALLLTAFETLKGT